MYRAISTVLIRLSAVLLAGVCTACATMSGAWYYQTGGLTDSDNLLFVVVNDTGKTHDIRALEINATDRGGALRWYCKSQDATGKTAVLPGRLLVVALPTQDALQCAVPTQGWAVLDNDRKLRLRLSRAMPTALPNAWRNTCMGMSAGDGGPPPKDVGPVEGDAAKARPTLMFRCRGAAEQLLSSKPVPSGRSAGR